MVLDYLCTTEKYEEVRMGKKRRSLQNLQTLCTKYRAVELDLQRSIWGVISGATTPRGGWPSLGLSRSYGVNVVIASGSRRPEALSSPCLVSMAVSVSTALGQKVDSKLVLKLVATSMELVFLTGTIN